MNRIALAVSTALSLAAGAAQAQETRGFKDWMATCDNLAACRAYQFAGEEASFGGYVMVRREAGPAVEPVVTIVVPPADGQTAKGQATWRVVVNGERLPGFENIAVGADDSDFWRAELSPARSRALLDAVRNFDELLFVAGNDQVGFFSLSGISAALLWIDDKQGRIGTTSALVRKGPKTAPAARAAPVVARGPAVSQAGLPKGVTRELAYRSDLKECEVDYTSAEDLSVARLAPGKLLWSIPCSRGAYNTTYLLLETDEKGGTSDRLDLPNAPGIEDGDALGELVNAEYDPATRTLSNFDKARGIGDCGSIRQWVWTGAEFKLAFQAVMPECHGVGPDDWPTIWRAEVR